MALANDFTYVKAADLDAALALKAQHGDQARFLAGGTDLVNNMNAELLSPEVVIDLKGIAELRTLRHNSHGLYLGALVTFSQLLDSPIIASHYPLLWEAASEVASIPIRNRATMVGNLCSCVPCMDSAPALVVYEAVAVLRGATGERRVPIIDFATGPRRTQLGPDEIFLGIEVPLPPDPCGVSYVKLKRYQGEDLSQAGVAVMVSDGPTYRVAFGSVGPRPIRAHAIEAHLAGKALTPEVLTEAKALVAGAIQPISDIRASKAYRQHMCEIMLGRALEAAAARYAGEGPPLGTRLA